jgi:hypothetical protein
MTTTISEIRQEIEAIMKIWQGAGAPSMFIWGKPGLGKSSMVKQLAADLNLKFVDVRLSQLAPTDIRGLPVVNRETNTMSWAPPNFLPNAESEPGILFLDEFNMASGSLMSIAQQLILDRRVGDYVLPDNWTIIAAGNRASDRASVNEMPAPVANRFVHFNAEPDLEDFKTWAYSFLKVSGKTLGTLIGFLNFRPELLHNSSRTEPAWPSPRTWEWAMKLYENGLDIAHVIGAPTALQFRAFEKVIGSLPDISAILDGDTNIKLESTKDPSVLYAAVSALSARATTSEQYINALLWIIQQKITEDYASLYVSEAMKSLKPTPKVRSEFMKKVLENPKTSEFVVRHNKLASGFNIK